MNSQQIDIRYGSYCESPSISNELYIPNLYGIQKFNVDHYDGTEITMGISPKDFGIEVYITNEFDRIIRLGPTEFIAFLTNLKSYFSINSEHVSISPIFSIIKFDHSDVYQIKCIIDDVSNVKINMKEKSILKLCEFRQCLIAMLNELKNYVMIYQEYFRKILFHCRDCIKENMSKNQILDHLLNISDEEIPKYIILETILKFYEKCLSLAIR